MQDQFSLEIEKQSILKHPFYRLWNEGRLSAEALRIYAKQYYHFVNNFPQLLEAMIGNCVDPEIRGLIAENLREEKTHPALWLAFAESLGLTSEEVRSSELLPETVESLQILRRSVENSTRQAAAALFAYEAQVPEVARQKMEGLMKFYGIDQPEALEFFKVHMLVDLDHVKVWQKILSQKTISVQDRDALKQSLSAQWRLLEGVLRVCHLETECGELSVN